MTLYRANERHPEDERILVLPYQDPDEIVALWHRRVTHDIDGIVWTHPTSPEDLETGAANITTLSQQDGLFEAAEPYRRYGIDPIEARRLIIHTWKDESVARMDEFDPTVRTVFHDLEGIFGRAVGSRRQGWAVVKTNSHSPHDFHQHDPVITFAFRKAGTLCLNKDQTRVYGIDAGQAALICESVSHKAPEPDDTWRNDPRVLMAFE